MVTRYQNCHSGMLLLITSILVEKQLCQDPTLSDNDVKFQQNPKSEGSNISLINNPVPPHQIQAFGLILHPYLNPSPDENTRIEKTTNRKRESWGFLLEFCSLLLSRSGGSHQLRAQNQPCFLLFEYMQFYINHRGVRLKIWEIRT